MARTTLEQHDLIDTTHLSESKRALLQRHLRGEVPHSSSNIARRPPGSPALLSFGQEQIWLDSQLANGLPIYNEPITLRWIGPLEFGALKDSLIEIIRRHEAWRTNFVFLDGRLVQVIHPLFELQLPIFDLRRLPEAEREAEALCLATEDARRPFDLEQGPLLRAMLVRFGPAEHRLFITLHHIIFDGVSIYKVFLPELATLYEAFLTGRPSPLPEPPIQYSDFAYWQRQQMGEGLSSDLTYWRQQLAGAPTALELPTDHARPPIQTFHGQQLAFKFPQSLTQRLKTLSRQEGTTFFVTLLAAFKTLLHRYTKQDDLLVGTVNTSRKRSEFDELIGFFLNTLVLRTDLSGDPTFSQSLQRLRKVTLDALAHSDVPFQHVVKELQLERDPSRHPLFQVMFSLEPELPVLRPGWDLSQVDVDPGTSRFDLYLELDDRREGLIGRFKYNSDLFDAQTIERMRRHFQTLLERVVANPNQRLSRLPILTEDERRELLFHWNNTASQYPANECVHQLFETQAANTPDRVAVIFEGEQLSYAELNSRANQLAHYLKKHGVGPEVIVGTCFERSLDMVVGLLGVLKAGGAYLPLDPAYPQKRLKLMLEDAGVSILLVQQHLRKKLPAHQAEVISLDSDGETLGRESTENPENECAAENLAYVMYTSGSTGRPKGVSVAHRSIVRLVKETNYVSLRPEEVFLQFAPVSFDASTFEIWGSLLNGARLVVMPPGLPSLEELGQQLKHNGVTTLWLTAGLFHQIVDTQLQSLGGIRQLLAGGDVLSVSDVEKVGRQLSGCQMINGYGPTENTTFTCCYRIRTGERFESSVPIGTPISNTQVYILDDQMEPVPVGVTGELYIGGDGLARGYVNAAVATAEKFVPNPFSGKAGQRLYRTGDRARYLADGRIEFLGRIDHQVKIRGFRIELGEIEAVLNEHPSISQSVVVARQQTPGEKRLVAYLVLSEEVETIISDLRRWLKQQLPEYMVPSAFVVMDELPLTANGKVDYRALPAPDGKEFLENAFVAPRNTLELLLTNTWEDVLEVRPIGVKDNFFDLGGNSLLAIRLFAQIEKVCGKKVPLATLFQAPTVEQLASLLSEEKWTPPWSSLVAIQPGGSKPPLFCLHLALGHVLFYRDLAQRLGTDQPVYAFQPQGLDGTRPRHTRIEEMAAHYIEEMRVLQPEGPYYLGGSSFGGLIAFEMAHQLRAQGQQVGLLALFDTYAPGFSNSSPESRSLRHQVHSLMQRVDLHVGNLLLLETEGKLRYAREKAMLVKGRLKWSIKKRIKKLRTRFSRSTVNSAPGEGQQEMDVALQPLREYVPQIYPGHVTLFRASKRPECDDDRDLGWGKLAEGVEIHEIPGYHGSIVMEPRVRILAEELQACLAQAQGSTSVNGRSSRHDRI